MPAPLADIAALAGQHADLCAAIAAASEEAASLRVVAELQERLAAFDAQVDAGEMLLALQFAAWAQVLPQEVSAKVFI